MKPCDGKRRFRTELEAQSTLKEADRHHNKIPKKHLRPMRHYFCAHCDGWHLTKRQPVEELRDEVKAMRKKLSDVTLENDCLKVEIKGLRDLMKNKGQ